MTLLKVIDLKYNPDFISQYISLRNKFCEKLLTHPVNFDGTKNWLKNDDQTVLVAMKDQVLMGAAILYLKKNGEISIFTKESSKGIGTLLLNEIFKKAKGLKLKEIHAWTLKDNLNAQYLFLKNGFEKAQEAERIYNSEIKNGIIFIKKI